MKYTDIRQQAVIEVITTGAALQQRLDGALGTIKGISFSEHRILAAIAQSPNGSGSRVDVARAVGLTASGVTRALRPLEKLGMVETIRDERDARRSLACLTEQGQELLSDADGVIADTLAALPGAQDLTENQAAALLDALSKLVR
ncbi:MAG: MarR family winged helix-turn-helix transcriptional regulator [Acidimicrobiales bacterium]